MPGEPVKTVKLERRLTWSGIVQQGTFKVHTWDTLATLTTAIYCAGMPMLSADLPADTKEKGPVQTSLLAIAVFIGLTLFAVRFDLKTHPQYYVAAIAGGLAFIFGINQRVLKMIDSIRHPAEKIKWLIAAILFVLSARYFLLSASLAERELFPKMHDEHMYLLQAQMLAHEHLWMPQHELADFFDSILVIVKPVYAAPYFPGTALLYVPGIWLNIAPWGTSILITAAIVGMFYIVITELLDGFSGLLAALLAVSLSEIRGLSVMVMSHTVILLLLLMTIWAFLRWQRTPCLRWAILIGIFGGWAAITRPPDAVCVILPIGLAMLWEMRKLPFRSRRHFVLAAVLAALPFLSLQLILNKGTTGSILRTPIAQYADDNFPGFSLGAGPRKLADVSRSSLPQMRDYYQQFLRPAMLEYNSDGPIDTLFNKRFMPALEASLPGNLLIVLASIGLLGIGTPANIAIVSGSLLIPLMYSFFPIYLKHYGLIASPAFILLALTGIEVLKRKYPPVGMPIFIAVAVLAVGSLPELRRTRDGFLSAPYLADINAKIARLEHKPAVVLFRYESGRTDVHEEPVYNWDVAWPDEAPVIRAQDRGSDNFRIFNYYASRQPQRFFYRYDRTTTELTPLGYAGDLAGVGNKNPATQK